MLHCSFRFLIFVLCRGRQTFDPEFIAEKHPRQATRLTMKLLKKSIISVKIMSREASSITYSFKSKEDSEKQILLELIFI